MREENILVPNNDYTPWFAPLHKALHTQLVKMQNIVNLLEAKRIQGTPWYEITIDDVARVFAIIFDEGNIITHI